MTFSARCTTMPKHGIRSVVYSVVEQVVLDLLQADVIVRTPEVEIAKFFDINAAAENLLERLLTSRLFMALIALTLVGKNRLDHGRSKKSNRLGVKDNTRGSHRSI